MIHNGIVNSNENYFKFSLEMQKVTNIKETQIYVKTVV